jgi:hypothetical protein
MYTQTQQLKNTTTTIRLKKKLKYITAFAMIMILGIIKFPKSEKSPIKAK